ncbi:hypothetical protein [Methylomonas sp. AM2-LC]|uniref:hypothetical protein n=1 Tax=Methylomonas sp. AM2-LC TaxID=3153301 RepID=UPI00326360B9
MKIKINKIITLTCVATVSILTGCAAGGGYANNNMAGVAAQSVLGGNPLTAMENNLANSLTQNLASSVLNGQIGSQVTSADQNFRVQQLGSLIQSGNISQSQQWVNPQTGSAMAINPVGQTSMNPQTRQVCQNLQEVVTMPNGQSLTESRLACQNPQTGQWSLVQ